MSFRRPLVASSAISALGVLVGAYLIRVHYDLDALVCGTGDCEVVQSSSYATVIGVPIAAFGTAMYVTLLALALIRMRMPRLMTPASAVALTITGTGTIYSVWLTWIEVYELEAICQWCVLSAILTVSLFVIEIVMFVRLWKL
jgi:uncharacterized membrane protein